MRIAALSFALLAMPMLAIAETYALGDLVIEQPVAKATPATAMAGAGYLTISNTGDTPDTLTGVRADFPRVMIHDTKVENDVATMFHIDGVTIAAGETVTFLPGGKHVMFMGLDGDPFEEGEEIAGTLIFENAGEIEVVFAVQTLEQIMDRIGSAAHGDTDHNGH